MRVSLIYELQMEKPWDDNAEYRTYWDAMEQIELFGREVLPALREGAAVTPAGRS